MNSMLLQATFLSGGVLLVFWVGYYFFLLRRIVLHNAGYLAFHPLMSVTIKNTI